MAQPSAVIETLLARHRDGLALPRGFYTEQSVYDHDLASYWSRNWLWAGHVSQIPAPGDYILFDYGPESIIVVRGRDGAIHAHLNVCRHRGSRICTEASGHMRALVCPYHAWTYELSGELRAGRAMGPDFNPGDWGLFPAQLLVFQGLIFVCASADAPPLTAALERLTPLTAPFGLERMKVAHQAHYPVPANWKLAVENYMECYHCAPAHPDYARSHSLKTPQDVERLGPALAERSAGIGLPVETLNETDRAASAPGADLFYRRYPLYDGYDTGSRSGAPLAPPLGDLSGFDGGATDLQIGPLNNFLIYADHVVGYRFVPRGLQETDIQMVWMVRDDAEEGRDYDRGDLTWLWHVTTLDDERIIRHNQAGVNSQFFQPGPLAEMEAGIAGFYHSYLTMTGTPASALQPEDPAHV